MPVAENLKKIKNALPTHVTLVAVSKTKPTSDIMEAYNAGQRIFGENKIQEMTGKWETMPKDIQWHMIGHVQRNKIKYMAPYVTLVHGVDSYKLLKEIDKQAKNNNRKIDCLLQVHIAEEETKFGLDESGLSEIITLINGNKLLNTRILGLMGMATFTQDENQVRKEFRYLKSLFDKTKNTVPELSVLSMGMSGDYHIAVEEGSNMVRIGSSIFGKR